ncbi:glycosyltransferase family 4 protein [Candidatus Daviesbacteria bacterium]|nr:glycosyltransferase family 4 protein [Candidatus Daviesbacteria bacterium]
MKVALDTSPLTSGHRVRGIGTYTKNLAQALVKIAGLELVTFQGGKIPDCDIVHYPYFDLFFQSLPIFKNKPTVVTIHDVVPLRFPQHFPSGIRGQLKFLLQKLSLQSARAVVTDSDASKSDIVKFLKVAPQKIFSIHLAPSPIFSRISDQSQLDAARQKYQLPASYILYVGDVSYNKNLPRLLEAIADLDVNLVMVGQAVADETVAETKELMTKINQLGLKERVWRLGFVADEDLVAIYNLAGCLVLPSLAEGFGLPVLEAMATGCPVVTSNISSMAEIAGAAAILVDPNDTKNISWGIREVLDRDKGEALREKGAEQVKKFSWDKTAQATVKVYRQVLGHE